MFVVTKEADAAASVRLALAGEDATLHAVGIDSQGLGLRVELLSES